MSEIKFEILKRIGTISETSNSSFELCLISWNNGKPKYDLRKWGKNGIKPYKGITITQNELKNILDILVKSKVKEKNNTVKYQSTFGKTTANIYDVLGEYKVSKNMPGIITYTSWGGSPKYDIRPWNLDYSICGKGISLNDTECDILINLIKSELNINNKEDYDTSDLDDVLLI